MSVTLEVGFLSQSELLEQLKLVSGGYRAFKDPFFTDGNKLLKPYVKRGVLSFGNEEDLHRRNHVECIVPGCNKAFETVFEYESHYNSLHRYLCSQCKKCLPSPHFLDLHLLEQHDSYFSVQAERKPMYSCFLEECRHVSQTVEERKDHCIKTHKFPPNFRFETSPLASKPKKDKRKSTEAQFAMEVVDETEMPHAKESTNLGKVPKNFAFGHQKQKAFSGKSYAKALASKEKNPVKSDEAERGNVGALEASKTVDDLMESLPN